MYADDDMPTEPLPRITGTAPILPRRIEEPEPPVEYVHAPRSPFLIPGIAALALFAFLVGVGVATFLGVDVSAPLQAEKPQATSSVPATAKPERRNPPKDTPVEVKNPPKPGPRTTNSVEPPVTRPAKPSSEASPPQPRRPRRPARNLRSSRPPRIRPNRLPRRRRLSRRAPSPRLSPPTPKSRRVSRPTQANQRHDGPGTRASHQTPGCRTAPPSISF